MSIDHGELLARLREIANGLADQQAMPDDTWERQWDEALATAQPAEAVEGDAHLKAVAQWFIAALGDLPDDYASLTSEKVEAALAANRHAYDEAMSSSLGPSDAAQGAVDYSPALHSVLSYIAYGECDEEGLHPGLFATVKEKIDKLRSKPVVDEAWLRQAIEEFKYLSGRTDLPMQDRERWRALNAALGDTP